MKPRVSIIAALSENNVIGRNNDLPWHIPNDLKRVRQLTTGHVLIMGRKTYESIGRPLPDRTTIIITRDKEYQAEGTIVVHSLEEALRIGKEKDSEEIFIFGGGQIFSEAIAAGVVDRLYLTLVHKEVEGDAYFPDYSEFTKTVSKEDLDSEDFTYTYLTIER